MGALQSNILFSSNINLIISHIPSCSEYYWDLWPNLKWLSGLNSRLRTYGARLVLFALKFGLCPSDATTLAYPPLPVHIRSRLFFLWGRLYITFYNPLTNMSTCTFSRCLFRARNAISGPGTENSGCSQRQQSHKHPSVSE